MGPAAARLRGLAGRVARPALGVSIALVLGTDVFFLTQRNVATPVSLNKSVARFRASQATTSTTAVLAAGAATTTTTTSKPGSPGAARATIPHQRAQEPAKPASPPPAGPFLSPAEGVYAYATTGYEKVSLGGARHDYPKESFATVRHGDGCRWDWEHRVVEEHVETARYCGLPNIHQFLGDTQKETFYGQTQSVDFTCDPPEIDVQLGDAPGSKRNFACSISDGSHADETVTYLGREQLTVDGTQLQAFHVLIEGRETGNVKGTSRLEMWLHPLTALLLREVVNVQSHSQAFGATVDYTEDASYTLEHLDPST